MIRFKFTTFKYCFINVRYYYKDVFSFFTASNFGVKGKKYKIPKNLPPDQIFVSATGQIPTINPLVFGIHWAATKQIYKLSDLKYNKKRDLYILKRSNYVHADWQTTRENMRRFMKCK